MSKLNILVLLLLTSSSAFAAIPDAIGPDSGELKFDGKIAEACNLMEFKDGTVVANLNQTEVSSLLSGGTAASVKVRANVNGFNLVMGQAKIFGPSGEVMDATITTEPVGNGVKLDGTPVSQFGPQNGKFIFDGGIYDFVVNANAQKQNGAFEAGNYQIKIPVSCVKGA